MKRRLVFMGSDPIALPALDALRSGAAGDVEIVAVYTQPDRARGRGQKVVSNEIKSWALDCGYPVYQPERIDRSARLEFVAQRPEAVLVMAYGRILSQALLDAVPLGIWNLHTSLLPKYRGASPIQAAIASGDMETGVSLMRMARSMDTGPVLDVERVPIGESDTALEVEALLAGACVPLLRRAFPAVLAGCAEPLPQIETSASYVRKLSKDDGAVDFSAPAQVLARRINALYPWPAARIRWNGVEIKLGLAGVDSADPEAAKPGTILEPSPAGLRVACGEGAVVLRRLQRPGGRMLDAPEFLRGFSMSPGERLASEAMPELVGPRPFHL